LNASLLGAIEGGGTKFLCAVGYGAERILERVVIATEGPVSTLTAALDFFGAAERTHGAIGAFGIASFGPLDLRRGSPSFGRLMGTPKPGWSGVDLVGAFRNRFNVATAIDTDVGAAALAELRLGAGRDVGSVAYVTVGTGIGAGFAPDLWNGARLLHPEMGHLRVRRHSEDGHFPGICPFHGDCVEGLASGPAIRARWGQELARLDPLSPAWAIEGHYLGELAASIALVTSPERIIFGGGVMGNGLLLPLVHRSARDVLNGYIEPLNDGGVLERYICSPGLGEGAGLAGAFLLAGQAMS
jgi:fructokinase